MKKKHFHSFIKLFRHIHHAGLILSGDFYKPGVEQKIKELSDVVDKFISQAPILLQKVLDETENNLYSIGKDDRESYVTSILKDFADIAPYLNYAMDKEYGKEYGKKVVKIGDQTYPSCIDDCHTLIVRHELKYTEHFDELTKPQQYIILSYRAYKDFFNKLDVMCFNLNIDLKEIQEVKEIHIFDRDMSFLQKFDLNGSLTHEKSKDHQDLKRSEQLKKGEKESLSINQIALLHVYQGLQITRENSNAVAKKYGHASGEKLYQKFTYYSSTTNRKGKPIPCTPKKLQNKIILIESVIEMLPEDKRSRAEDEVKILQSLFNSEYL